MQLNSIPFLFYFLPAFLVLYYLAPIKYRYALLTAASFLFLWLASGKSLLAVAVLAGLTVVGYVAMLFGKRNPWLTSGAIVLLAGVLIFFKLYRGGALFPVGLSFYVFQLIAFVAEKRRGHMRKRMSPGMFGACITMFPKLLSGPIADPQDMRRQIEGPRWSIVTFHLGLRQLILGLAMKVILADRMGAVWDRAVVMGFDSVSVPFMWLALLSWSLQLYLDFYGYSLIAVGLGHMLGFHLPMNFLEPYSAKSISEFFRRWHVTLGRWFREYVYIPLGGNRKGLARTIVNLAVVWLLTGLWHGVGSGYLMWAGILWALIVLERVWLRPYLEKSRVVCHIYTVLLILLSFVPFAAGGAGEAMTIYGRLFGIGPEPSGIGDFLNWGGQTLWLLLAGIFFATPLPKKIWETICVKKGNDGKLQTVVDIGLFVLFWICVYFIATSKQDPFLYFHF